MIVHCAKCDKSFETYPYKIKKHKHLFCSTICQYEFKKTSSILKCRICEAFFQIAAHRIKNQKECFCSKKCANKALEVPRITTNCKTCGIEIQFLESRLKHSNRGYCSLPCFYKNQKTRKTHFCEACNKEFLVAPSEEKNKRGRFCSKTCYSSFCKKENSPNYKHGHGWFRNMSRETRSNKCEICDKIGKTDIHHIDGNERNNTNSNFITVCRSCHMRIHHLSGRRGIPIKKSLEIFKIIRLLPPHSRSTWELVEKLKTE